LLSGVLPIGITVSEHPPTQLNGSLLSRREVGM
jgi:hypothetical protein